MKKFCKRNIVVLSALAASIAWLLALALLSSAFSWSRAVERFAELQALELNSMGDFLAGVFAPLAFTWFIAAVFIQSVELRHQREELRRTRIEFALNRRVTIEQAHEAKRQALFVEQQTDIVRRHQYDQTLDMHIKLVVQHLKDRSYRFKHTALDHLPDDVWFQRAFSEMEFAAMQFEFGGSVAYIANFLPLNYPASFVNNFLYMLRDIISLTDNVSPAKAAFLKNVNVRGVADVVELALEKLPNDMTGESFYFLK